MLLWITAAIIATAALITIDLLCNDEIFSEDSENHIGNGHECPFDNIDLLSCDTSVEITELDEARIMDAVCDVRSVLGDAPVKTLSEMDANERIKKAQEIHTILCERFSLNLDLQMGTSDCGVCGQIKSGGTVMWVDYRYLLSTDTQAIKEYLDTIIHEFRHAMQFKYIENGNYNGASEEYRKKMACSLHHDVYVSFEENPELYYKQLCERDATAFASRFMEKLYGDDKND